MGGGKEAAYAAVYGDTSGSEYAYGPPKPMVYCCYPSAAHFAFSGYVHEYVWLQDAIPIDMLAQEDGLRRGELSLGPDEILQDDVTVMLRCDELWVFGDHVSKGMEHEMHAWHAHNGRHKVERLSWADIGVPEPAIEYFYETLQKGAKHAKAQD